jgi:hypothetical protein
MFQRVLFARLPLQTRPSSRDEPFPAVDTATVDDCCASSAAGTAKAAPRLPRSTIGLVREHFPKTLLLAREVGWGPTSRC